MPTLSLLTCTRNPSPEALRLVVQAIEALHIPDGWDREFILVDSASAPPLADRPEDQLYAIRAPWARTVRATEPGLATARRLALRESRGELLIWFDDDNVPAPDYLDAVVRFAAAYPQVTVWGAGTIVVEFTSPVPRWVESDLPPFFQEREHGRDEVGSSRRWAPFFPVGSGLVTRRVAMQRWAAATEAGRYTLTGRSGARLGAGDDAQIIFGAIAAGELVGVAAGQRLQHLIPAFRCTPDYLARLEFGLSASLRVARAECFPDDPDVRGTADLGLISAARSALVALRSHGLREGPRFARFELARRLGALAGTLQTMNRPEPVWLRAAIGALRLR
jgi:hypothetical protein